MIEIILLQNWGKLGKFGDRVKVRPGFARNYLVPQGKAMSATAANTRKFERERDALKIQQQAQLSQVEARAAQLSALGTLIIPVRVGVEGKLFGSVTTRDIVEHLKKQGIEIDKKELRFPEKALRSLGSTSLTFMPHPHVQTAFTLQLVDENSAVNEERSAEV